MTKQEEIRDGIKEFIEWAIEGKKPSGQTANIIMSYLHEQGAVVKVNRELPRSPHHNPIDVQLFYNYGYERCQKDMASYEAVEPIIEESND